jgi:hypothetical protein
LKALPDRENGLRSRNASGQFNVPKNFFKTQLRSSRLATRQSLWKSRALIRTWC